MLWFEPSTAELPSKSELIGEDAELEEAGGIARGGVLTTCIACEESATGSDMATSSGSEKKAGGSSSQEGIAASTDMFAERTQPKS